MKMGVYNKQFFLPGIMILCFLLSCQPSPSSDTQQNQNLSYFKDENSYTELKNKTSRIKSYSIPDNNRVLLDSLSSLKISDSLYQNKYLFKLDGKAHFFIKKSTHRFVIFTGMMKLETQAVDFKIKAYSSSPGQSLKVLKGKLIATKSYQSDFPNTDTLRQGEMILINRDIDLMEKEAFDTTKNNPQKRTL